MTTERRLVAMGEPNGKPLVRPYVWRANEQGRAEADAAFLADARRRARERFEAGLPPEFTDVPDPVDRGAAGSGTPDLPAGAGATPPVTTAPCAADEHAASSTAKGDSRPADDGLRSRRWGAGSDAETLAGPASALPHPPEVQPERPAAKTAEAAPPVRCRACGYLTRARGHLATCGGDT